MNVRTDRAISAMERAANALRTSSSGPLGHAAAAILEAQAQHWKQGWRAPSDLAGVDLAILRMAHATLDFYFPPDPGADPVRPQSTTEHKEQDQ